MSDLTQTPERRDALNRMVEDWMERHSLRDLCTSFAHWKEVFEDAFYSDVDLPRPEEIEKLRTDQARLNWCAENQIQFGVTYGAEGYPDCWIVYTKNRWDQPLGEGASYREAVDAAMSKPINQPVS